MGLKVFKLIAASGHYRCSHDIEDKRRSLFATSRRACCGRCCYVPLGPSGQIAVSRQLLELDNEERNAAFTLMLMDSG